MARFPHEYETWLFDGHTIPNGDPPDPLDDSVGFIGWLVSLPMTVEPSFVELEIDEEKTIFFLAIYPLYQTEMDFKLAKGNEKLMQRFEKNGYSEIVVADRRDVTKKRFRLF